MKIVRILLQLCIFALVDVTFTQTIKTNSKSGTAWTTGNINRMHTNPSDTTLFGLIPGDDTVPMIIDEIYLDRLTIFQTIISTLIFDFADIDQKEFAPESETYILAFQRRLDLFQILIKVILGCMFIVYFLRLHYGVAGGFKKKVQRLRGRNKKIPDYFLIAAVVIFLLFGVPFCVMNFASSQIIDDPSIKKNSESQAKVIKDDIQNIKATLDRVNVNRVMSHYRAKKTSPHYFKIANVIKSELSTNKGHQDQYEGGESIPDTIFSFNINYMVFSMVWLLLNFLIVAVLKEVYKRRMVIASLTIAFFCILLICGGILLIGYKYSNISLKVEMCKQALNIVEFGMAPVDGDGLTKMIYGFGVKEKNQMKEQIYAVTLGINSSYIVYLNRLMGLGRKDDAEKIKSGQKTKTLIAEFMKNNEKDKILRETYYIIYDLTDIYNKLINLKSAKYMKYWAYKYSNKVCRYGLIIEFSSMLLLCFSILGTFLAFIAAWKSEHIIRCIIFEEKMNLDMNRFRHDWV